MQRKKGGLGRGLGSLIPQGPVEPEEAAEEETAPAPPQAPSTGLLEVPVDSIRPNPQQPRHSMQQNQLEELAESIRGHGVLQPLVVTREAEGKGKGKRYTLVAGERRWRASMLAGLEMVPVVVKEATSEEMLELALVENLQRADLNPLEEANAYRTLVHDFGLKHDEVAARVGKSRIAVANSLRLLKLPQRVQEALAAGQISEGHARAILQVPNEEAQVWLAEKTAKDGLSVRQVEALARHLAEQVAHPHEEEKPRKDEGLYDEMRNIEDRFRDALGTKVQLSRSSRGGRLVIYFYSDEELDRIFGAIVGEDE